MRPNVLFLMSDEHRPDVTGYEGNDVIRTPTLDFLAETGVVFRNAYAASPICVPGRQCLMSGQLPMTCGCHRFGDDLPPNSMTFARRFAQYAYITACAGKLHHTGPDQMQGWTVRIGSDARVTDRYFDGKVEDEFEKYGPAPGTGKWSNQKEIERAGAGASRNATIDEYATLGAIQYLDRYFADQHYDRPESHRPLLFKLSLLQPHYAFKTDEAKFRYYLNRVPIYEQDRADHPVLSRTQMPPDVNATPRDIRRATAAYYGMIETVDSHFKRVLETLEELGQDIDDWIIVYTSDHGEMLGEHGIWEKTQFYEGSCRVPLIIRWPKRFAGGTVVNENVNLCDLFATLCDLAGLPVPEGRDSRSLVPLMNGDTSGWVNETVSAIGRNQPTAANHLMIKHDALKYCWYGPSIPEVLFDLEKDPNENVNFIDDSSYAGAVERFRARRDELGYGPQGAEGYTGAGYSPYR